MRDLIVVGGGPIGLATALHAARAGLDVEVRERRAGVLDKACGEGLMPGAVAELAALGVRLTGRSLTGIRYLDGDHSVEADFRHGPGLGVRRTALHTALTASVDAAGVPVTVRPVRRVSNAGDHVVVDGDPVRYVIAADGLHSPVRRQLELAARPARLRRYGLRAHVETAPWSDHVEVYWSRHAEAYVTPVADRLVGLAVLSGARRPFGDLLADFPELLDRVGGEPTGPVRGAGPLRQRARRRVAGRVLLVGDAAGYVDALTGEGIAVGVAQARAAVAAVVAGRPADYESAWHRIGRRHDLMTRSLLTAGRVPPVRRRIVAVADRWPSVFDAGVNLLAKPGVTREARPA